MNARKTLARVIERIAPERVAEIRKTNREKRTAMQAMLAYSCVLRGRGYAVAEINELMRPALDYYKRGQYSGVADFLPNIW